MKASTKLALMISVPLGAFVGGFVAADLKRGEAPKLGLLASASPDIAPGEIFNSAFENVRKGYFKDLNSTELRYAGLGGVMASLGDPHTMFFEPVVATAFNKETEGNIDFVGVGARLMRHDRGAKIFTVFDDGPARSAGLKAGDIVIGVNGAKVEGMPVEDIVTKIRGKEGTPVSLRIYQRATGQERNFTMNRAKVLAPTVDGARLEGTKVGYIMVNGFSQVTDEQFAQVLDRVDAESADGLVIDLRGNLGGLLDTATSMLSFFMEDKIVVTIKERGGKERVERTGTSYKRNITCPLVILMNEDSASASEIFAGVLHDYGMATLVGEHTYGKGSVQTVVTMSDGSSAKITVAKYYLPSGQNVDRTTDEDGTYLSGGIAPDVVVPLSLNPKTQMGDPEFDNQLAKALEIIKSKRS